MKPKQKKSTPRKGGTKSTTDSPLHLVYVRIDGNGSMFSFKSKVEQMHFISYMESYRHYYGQQTKIEFIYTNHL